MKYEVTIGLEVHIQLKTATKLFCGCGIKSDAEPNTTICHICLGYPGTLPWLNREAVRLAAMAGMLLDSQVSKTSCFDRKNYFYPDVSKNYQTTQLDYPICLGGHLDIVTSAGEERRIGITRIHLEEDVAKSIHYSNFSGIDFNRCGVPLIELVTEPDMKSPEEALLFLHGLRQVMVYGGIGECNLELGNMRCDANISLKPIGAIELGTKIELKNLNTFKGVQAALAYEIERQAEILDNGGVLAQETRRWDADLGESFMMRGKVDELDYRYLRDPDLPPVVISDSELSDWRALLPERPADRRRRLVEEYGIPAYDAGVLVAEKSVADFYEKVVESCGSGKLASNWIMTDILRLLGESNRGIEECALTPQALGSLIKMVADGRINQSTARELLLEIFSEGGDPELLVEKRGLVQVGDQSTLNEWIEAVISENPDPVSDYMAGKKAVAGYLVGQVMKISKGKADPKLVGGMMSRRLAAMEELGDES